MNLLAYSSITMYKCEQCSFVCSSIGDLLWHFRVVNHINFHCHCCFEGCSAEFSTAAAFKSHVYCNHYERAAEKQTLSASNSLEQSTSEDPPMETNVPIRDPNLQADLDRLTGKDVVDQKRASALFLLKLKEIHRVPQVAVDSIVSGSQEIFQQTVQRLRAGVQQKLAAAGVDVDTAQDIGCVFDELSDPFTGLESEYKQAQYMTKEFNIFVSCKTKLQKFKLLLAYLVQSLCNNAYITI